MKVSKIINNKSLQHKIFPHKPTDFKFINPVNNKFIKEFNLYSDEQIEKVLENSKEAFKKWRILPLKERLKKMEKLADKLESYKEELGILITQESGKTITDSKGEVTKTIKHIKYYLENAEKHLYEQKNFDFEGFKNSIEYQPLGPILDIVPWNYPLWVGMKSVIPCMIAGNTVVYKPSANVPQTSLKIEEIFKTSGFEGEFQVLFANHKQIEEKVIADDRIKSIIFTGSSEAGKSIGASSARYLKKAFLELGGSDPFIVLKDADIDAAVKAAAEGRLRNAGQACICAKRTIIHESIFDEFVEKLKKEIKENYKLGDPMDENTKLGPVARFDLFLNLKKQVLETLDMDGAELIDAKYEDVDEEWSPEKGNFFTPILLKNIKKDSPIYKEEVFGPVFSLYTFKTDEEAIELANDTRYGLGGSVFTKDEKNAEIYKRDLQCGMLFINAGTISDSRLPYGGTKESGYGRTSAWTAFQEFTNNKVISAKF